MIQFINPVAECMVVPNPYTLGVDFSKSLKIALVINKIVDCDVFMQHVGESLREHHPNIELHTFFTERITFADSALIDSIASECDAAVCAIGHCGSCTAGTVKDAIALVERGVPAVSLITDVFWQQGGELARSLGWPEFPRVRLPYPIWGTGESSMREVAASIVHDVKRALSASSYA
ncbi:MAG: UGSC family (seleno)protein [Pseudomonadota bacterium]